MNDAPQGFGSLPRNVFRRSDVIGWLAILLYENGPANYRNVCRLCLLADVRIEEVQARLQMLHNTDPI